MKWNLVSISVYGVYIVKTYIFIGNASHMQYAESEAPDQPVCPRRLTCLAESWTIRSINLFYRQMDSFNSVYMTYI